MISKQEASVFARELASKANRVIRTNKYNRLYLRFYRCNPDGTFTYTWRCAGVDVSRVVIGVTKGGSLETKGGYWLVEGFHSLLNYTQQQKKKVRV